MEKTSRPKKQRLFRWALWSGLAITVVSIVLLLIPGTDDGSDPVTSMFYTMIDHNYWLLLIVVGIMAPVFEELTFRLWGNGKALTGIISSILMALLMLITFNWYIGLISLAAGLVVTLAVKDRNRRLLLMMILSSLLFMFAHVPNYSGNVFSTALALVEKFGFGLLASYLVINHNILWSMVLHILNNSIACIVVIAGVANLSPTTFTTSNGQCQVSIKPIIHNPDIEINYWAIENGDTVTYNNKLEYITVRILDTETEYDYHGYGNDTVAVYTTTDLPFKYSLQAVFDPAAPHRLTPAVQELERQGWLRLDTTLQQAYMISIVDSSLRYLDDDVPAGIWAGAYSLQRLGLPMLQPDDFNYHEWPIDDYYQVKSIEDARLMLERYGLTLEPCDRQMTMIAITNLHDPLAEL